MFAQFALAQHACSIRGTDLREHHLDRAGEPPPLGPAHREQSLRSAEIGQHRRDIVCDWLIAYAKLPETLANEGKKKALQLLGRGHAHGEVPILLRVPPCRWQHRRCAHLTKGSSFQSTIFYPRTQ